MERDYYVNVAPDVARAKWHDFEHALDFPGAEMELNFEEMAGEPRRTHVRIRVKNDSAATDVDDAIRQFRLFLESRGLIERTTVR